MDNRLFGTIVCREKTRKVVVGFRQVGSNDEGLLVVIDRLLGSLQRAQRIGKVMMDRSVVRPDGERLLVTGDRLLRTIEGREQTAESRMGVSGLGGDASRTPEQGEGTRQVPVLHANGAPTSGERARAY